MKKVAATFLEQPKMPWGALMKSAAAAILNVKSHDEIYLQKDRPMTNNVVTFTNANTEMAAMLVANASREHAESSIREPDVLASVLLGMLIQGFDTSEDVKEQAVKNCEDFLELKAVLDYAEEAALMFLHMDQTNTLKELAIQSAEEGLREHLGADNPSH